MNSLRFVSISDDGAHLIVSNDAGERFSVPVTDELRGALARRRAAATTREPTRLSPREIQSRIRLGATSEEVAAETGLPLERIESYAAPVRAERDHAAALARGTEVSDRTLTRDAVRAVFGEQPVTIENMVEHRASVSGIEPASIEWDAWRRADGQWDVVARFEVTDTTPLEGTDLVDAEPEARWVFNALRKSVHNVNRWAQFLSELEPLDAAHGRRLAPVPAHAEDADDAPAAAGTEDENGELLDMLSQRRGTRLGTDEEADDRLAQIISDRRRAAEEQAPVTAEDEADEDDLSARRKPKKSLKDRRSRVPSWDQIYFGAKPDNES
ncbi:septation protein SepH [Falsarthrobacter nasiphocae]|uniref:DUF3071 domain-containing protein n=1 Tax=Falsarthrobacter nasiphocae TaxID=189863 RepID=A0AAE3YG19_9MICC|nr:septation protein SepH [Falsarthrobacter nasiphocae]MDR6891268.1 hypothetical protein [Falsarthrobacter nasiphocae]